MNLNNYDWTKLAAQVIDDNEVERAFMDQAYGFIANKAGPLMQDPHRLGFEVVHKNDANTRMVGIFAFRIDDQLLYAPVFFLNGEIKGTDLLYQADQKKFRPLNEEWVTHLLESKRSDLGRGIARKETMKVVKDLNLDEIAYPPSGHSKGASEQAGSGSLLRRFLIEDGKAEALEKLATWMGESVKFAEAMVTNFDEADYMPAEMIEMAKEAAQAQRARASLMLYLGGLPTSLPSTLTKQAKSKEDVAKDYFSKGYALWDDRAPTKLNPVYEDRSRELVEVRDAGTHEVLMSDGSFRTCFTASASRERWGGCHYNEDHTEHDIYSPATLDVNDTAAIVLVAKDGAKETACSKNHVYGTRGKTMAELINDGELATSMSKGNAYRVFDAEAGTLTGPIYCTGKKTRKGITTYTIVDGTYDGSREFEIRHNPDVIKTDIRSNFLGEFAYFIPVGTARFKASSDSCCSPASHDYYYFTCKTFDSPKPGHKDSLNNWLTESGIKSAAVLYDGGTDMYSFRAEDVVQSHYMPRLQLAVKMAKDLRIHADTVETILDTAQAQGSYGFMFGDPEFGTKQASMMRVVDGANFRQSMDPTFNTLLEHPQQFELETDAEYPEPEPQRVGDAYDPGMGLGPQEDSVPREMMSSSSPEELAQYAAQKQLPNIFEHGVVGTLVQTYDSVAMVDKYLPELEEALDRLGRLLFLLYWKPRDFEDAYGSDDMNNLENQILSNFKSFGELVLELLKKTQARRVGNVSFGSN